MATRLTLRTFKHKKRKVSINSIRIRTGVILQRYRKHYCVTYSHNISCFVRVLGGFHMRVAVDAAVDVEN